MGGGNDESDSSQQATEEQDENLQGKEAGEASESSCSKENAASAFQARIYFAAFLLSVGFIAAIISGIGDKSEGSPLSMPALVRDHYASGRFIKVDLGSQQRSVKVFVRTTTSKDRSTETVVLLHGMGSSSFLYRKVIPLLEEFNVIALDFPGSGLSDKYTLEQQEASGLTWVFAKVRQVFIEILEKGPFWRLEEMFETGSLPNPPEVMETVEFPVGGDTEQLVESLEQVLDSIGVDQVHLVAHDTGSEAARVWALRHPSRVRTVTIIDSSPGKPGLPVFLLSSPYVGTLLLSCKHLYYRILNSCCLQKPEMEIADAYAFLLRNRGGRSALLEMAMMLNSTLSLGLWSQMISDTPVQVLWAASWSDEWQEEGQKISDLLPDASLVYHSGSRWPQEDAPEEVAMAIKKLVWSVPKLKRAEVDEEGSVKRNDAHSPHFDEQHHHEYDHYGHMHHSHGHDHHDHHHHGHDYAAWGM